MASGFEESLQPALDALKNRQFAAARDLIARQDTAAFTVQHFLIKGLAELSLQEWVAARDTFSAACGRFPDEALFWLNRGIAEENLGYIVEAAAAMKRCAALNPALGDAYGNLSNLYRKQKRFAEAEDMARRALANGAAKADALNSLGLALGRQGKFAEAEKIFAEAQADAPGNAMILHNHANLALDQLDFDRAWNLFAQARAIEDHPVFRHDEGLARLLAGDYRRGWDLFEARLERPQALRIMPACPRWRGENLTGKKLLIVAEQGFGDVIQFCRYGAFMPEGELVWAVPNALVRLLSGSVRGSVLREDGVLPACDYWAPIFSLPLLTGQVAPQPMSFSFHAPDAPALPSGKYGKKIGLVWAGSRTHERDHERSLKLKQLMPALDGVAADFYAPFTGAALEEIGGAPVIRLDALINDFADTAALLKQMDCVISVDTAIAHLAGALGIRVILLLAFCPDWRWGTSGETTPWYPSMSLLRQPAYGDWGSAINHLPDLLKRRL